MSVNIQLEDQEITAFFQICDLALRQGGMGCFDAVAHFRTKISQVQQAANPRPNGPMPQPIEVPQGNA